MRAHGVDGKRGPWVQMFSGRKFYILTQKPEEIFIEDIAHHESIITRWCGATREPYTDAEHSVRVSRLCSPEHALEGLLHDATEAVVGDLPRPLKKILPEYKTIERIVAKPIGDRFGVDLVDLPLEVHLADSIMLVTEARDHLNPMLDGSEWWREAAVPTEERLPPPWDWREAERKFLETFNELMSRRAA